MKKESTLLGHLDPASSLILQFLRQISLFFNNGSVTYVQMSTCEAEHKDF